MTFEDVIESGGDSQTGFQRVRLTSGKSSGVEVVRIWAGGLKVHILPTRGMGIWRAERDQLPFGWNSPIAGPIHPQWVPVSEQSGLGWLDGFDELMVRCGLESNGAPEHDQLGRLVYPLHGRVANLPASDVEVEIDGGKLLVRGRIEETRFHFQRFELVSEISIELGSPEIAIIDHVKNLGGRKSSFQMLYHNNFGSPLLGEGSTFHAPVNRVGPKANYSAVSPALPWNQYGPPTNGYEEQVYFMKLGSEDDGQTVAMLESANRDQAATIEFNVSELPCFTLWKNCVSEADGYVTGLEPGTNFPNTRSHEQSKGRVVELGPEQTYSMKVKIGLLTSAEEVQSVRQRIDAIHAEGLFVDENDPWD